MHSRKLFVLSIVVIFSLLLGSFGTVLAQETPPAPPQPGEKPGGSFGPARQRALDARTAARDAVTGAFAVGSDRGEGALTTGTEVEAEADISAQAGSTDAFGYVKKTAKFSWIDATAGTVLDFSEQPVQAVALPFSFPFYENSYNLVKVVQHGYLSFSQHPAMESQAPILTPYEPNNVIAPYWTPIDLEAGGDVFMAVGGTEPERYVVFQWNDVSDEYTFGSNRFTFEAVLYENGNILFQYATMKYTWGWNYPSAGIEDDTGQTGLISLKYKSKQKSNRAISFVRPVNYVSLKLFPTDYGALTGAGAPARYPLSVTNMGALAPDTFDLKITSKWPAAAYGADGITPLIDTDGDRKIDTGPVAPGATVDVVITITPPLTAVVGNSKSASVTFTSSLKTSRKKTALLTTAIPAAFTQAYTHETLTGGQVLGSNFSRDAAEQDFEVAPVDGYAPATARMASGNGFYAWSEYACPDDLCERVFYSIRDAAGAEVLGATGLALPPEGTWEYAVAPAAAPNGNVGLTFLQEVWSASDEDYIDNIYFVLLDSDGAVLEGPVNVTDNASIDISYDNPQIIATDDSNFVLAFDYVDLNDALMDIYTATYGDDGGQLKPPAAITASGDSGGGYYNSSLTLLPEDKLLVAYNGFRPKGSAWTEYAFYTILEATSGAVVRPETGISLGKVFSYGMDTVRMSNGQVVLAWGVYKSNKEAIQYAVLKDVTYKKAKGPVTLSIKPALTGSWYLSVTSDTLGHGIITWADNYQSFGRHLYYAMVGNNGAMLTKPMVFMTSPEASYLYLNPYGYGNMPFSLAVPE